MGRTSPDAEPSQAPAAQAPAAKTSQRSPWGSGPRSRNAARLKLLGALRGDGQLIWSGGELAVAYELDVYRRGSGRVVSGNLEGDFSALLAIEVPEGEAVTAPETELRLADGYEISVTISDVEPTAASFDGAEDWDGPDPG